MKKQSFILWISSIVIVFVISYINTITSDNYPITGTIGVEGKKVSYRFEKVYYGNGEYYFSVRSDFPDLTGKYFFKPKDDSVWTLRELVKDKFLLTGVLPKQKPEVILQYYAELIFNNKSINIPDNRIVQITYYGEIPIVVNLLQFFFLYGGLILAIRTGLESFNNNLKTKKFAVMFLIIFLTLNVLINPLYLSYKYGFINHSVPPIERLFSLSEILILLLWIITAIVLFNRPKFKYTSLSSAVITLIIFLLFS